MKALFLIFLSLLGVNGFFHDLPPPKQTPDYLQGNYYSSLNLGQSSLSNASVNIDFSNGWIRVKLSPDAAEPFELSEFSVLDYGKVKPGYPSTPPIQVQIIQQINQFSVGNCGSSQPGIYQIAWGNSLNNGCNQFQLNLVSDPCSNRILAGAVLNRDVPYNDCYSAGQILSANVLLWLGMFFVLFFV